MDIITAQTHGGDTVLGRWSEALGKTIALTFATRTQAKRALASVGAGWELYEVMPSRFWIRKVLP